MPCGGVGPVGRPSLSRQTFMSARYSIVCAANSLLSQLSSPLQASLVAENPNRDKFEITLLKTTQRDDVPSWFVDRQNLRVLKEWIQMLRKQKHEREDDDERLGLHFVLSHTGILFFLTPPLLTVLGLSSWQTLFRWLIRILSLILST